MAVKLKCSEVVNGVVSDLLPSVCSDLTLRPLNNSPPSQHASKLLCK